MAKHILKCQKCNEYTLHQICKCGDKALEVKPPKYSPQDPYAKYRRIAKKDSLQKKGLL
ncbi:ribosome biogenesis protein [Candidatus Woesearchaeota archaeon]|nr:ribosome biogenesis protein [Candidatus Woesearchaeota archaeon]